MVRSVDNKNGVFSYISVFGEYVQAQTRQVSVAIRGHFPKIAKPEYNSKAVALKLTKIVQTANAELPTILPFAPVVHARYSTDNWPRPLGFSFLCSTFDELIERKRSVRPAQPANRLAVYLALAYHSLEFVRTKHSDFVAVPKKTMTAVNKIMYALTRTELEHGVADLKQTQTTPNPASIAGNLLSVLQHWVLWNDTRLTEAIQTVLKTTFNHTRPMDSHRALSSAVNQIKKIDLFPWVGPTKSSRFSGFGDCFPDPVSQQPPYPVVSTNSSPLVKVHNSHLFTTNLIPGSVILSDSLSASFDPEAAVLNIFIPRVQGISSVLSPQSEINSRSRTLCLKGAIHPLISGRIATKHRFRPGIECPAIRLQVKTDPRNRFAWDTSSATVAIAETVPVEISRPFHFKDLTDALVSVPPVLSDYELRLPRNPKIEFEASSHLGPALSIHAQAAAGRIAGLYLRSRNIETPFVVTTHSGQERISHKPGWHERIKFDAYVPVARPLDSALALISQKKLIGQGIPTLYYDGSKRMPLDKKMQELVVPGLNLADILERRDRYYQVLHKLQTELQESLIFHIFRCTLLESGSNHPGKEGQLIKAHCIDIGLDVEVFVPAKNEQVYAGDQIICTEILELDPLFGLMVLSM